MKQETRDHLSVLRSHEDWTTGAGGEYHPAFTPRTARPTGRIERASLHGGLAFALLGALVLDGPAMTWPITAWIEPWACFALATLTFWAGAILGSRPSPERS